MRTYTEGEVLKALRERFTPPQGTTKEQVARELGCSDKFIYKVLAGSVQIPQSLVNALGFREQPRTFVRVK
jgi:hypothetical protein